MKERLRRLCVLQKLWYREKINGLLKMKKKVIDKMHKKGKVKSIELLMM